MGRLILAVAILGGLCWALSGEAPMPSQDAPKPALKFWKDIPEQAEVMAATFLGGKGHDWLVSGGFQPDGTIILVGNVIGPVLDLPVAEKVIGTDRDKPGEAKRVPLLERGQQKTDTEGRPLWEKPSWRHDGVTGFVVRCSRDLKKVLSVHRMPWTSGAITTALVDKDGAIYIAGRTTESIVNLSADVDAWEIGAESMRKSGSCRHTFVARLKPDCSKAEWLRHAKGYSDAPQMTLLPDGSLRFGAQDLRTVDVEGKLLDTAAVPGGIHKTTSISPTDGSIAIGGEHQWPTGREAWRCPTLHVLKPDGTLQYQLYDWSGPYVGLDNSRLIADAAVRLVRHDRDGNLLLYAWSDAGNSVMTRLPTDVRTDVGLPSLGISAAGASGAHCAYLIQIEPRDFRVIGWTPWLAFAPNGKSSSVWIDTLGKADDGSFCFAGRSAWGLWQTKNRLGAGEPAGDYIAVLTPAMSGVRFCSVLPGTGVCEVEDGGGWGIAAGSLDGKPRVLFVGSAVKETKNGDTVIATPTKNALQDGFGGGWSDGYAVLLDLSKGNQGEVVAPPEPAGQRPSSARFETAAAARPIGETAKPANGAVFDFRPNFPKHVTVDAEFRDRAGRMWPSFLYGVPVEGSFTTKDDRPAAQLSVACRSICQPKGDQTRRVLGELIKADATPRLQFNLEALGPPKSIDLKTSDNGKEITRTVDYCDSKGTLELAGKKVAVTPRVTYTFTGPKGGGADTVSVSAFLVVKGTDLGLKAAGTNGDIDVRISMTGSAATQEPKK